MKKYLNYFFVFGLMSLSGLSIVFYKKNMFYFKKSYFMMDGRNFSLKKSAVNLRSGPGFSYPIVCQYQQKNLPFVLKKIKKNWGYVCDPQGVQGWIFLSLLDKRRTFLFHTIEPIPFYADRRMSSQLIGWIHDGVIAYVLADSDEERGWWHIELIPDSLVQDKIEKKTYTGWVFYTPTDLEK